MRSHPLTSTESPVINYINSNGGIFLALAKLGVTMVLGVHLSLVAAWPFLTGTTPQPRMQMVVPPLDTE
jgi:hypothetical protein